MFCVLLRECESVILPLTGWVILIRIKNEYESYCFSRVKFPRLSRQHFSGIEIITRRGAIMNSGDNCLIWSLILFDEDSISAWRAFAKSLYVMHERTTYHSKARLSLSSSDGSANEHILHAWILHVQPSQKDLSCLRSDEDDDGDHHHQ